MEENMIGEAETRRIAYLNKKRKIRAELLETPLSKQACRGQKPKHDSLSDSSTEQKRSGSSESDAEPAKDSCSLHSLESRLLKNASPSKSESLSLSDELECLRRDYGLDIYEDPLLEFGAHVDCVCLECQADGVEHPMDTDINEMIYSNGLASSNYVLSSGRPVNQDAPRETKKLTIDKEFEEYFSMLML